MSLKRNKMELQLLTHSAKRAGKSERTTNLIECARPSQVTSYDIQIHSVERRGQKLIISFQNRNFVFSGRSLSSYVSSVFLFVRGAGEINCGCTVHTPIPVRKVIDDKLMSKHKKKKRNSRRCLVRHENRTAVAPLVRPMPD